MTYYDNTDALLTVISVSGMPIFESKKIEHIFQKTIYYIYFSCVISKYSTCWYTFTKNRNSLLNKTVTLKLILLIFFMELI